MGLWKMSFISAEQAILHLQKSVWTIIALYSRIKMGAWNDTSGHFVGVSRESPWLNFKNVWQDVLETERRLRKPMPRKSIPET